MKCNNPEIPSYLHWNNRGIFLDEDFKNFHKLYRIRVEGNPIEIPEQWINAISCKWSKLIKKKHILLQPEKNIGNDYDFVYVQEIREYRKQSTLDTQHDYKGTHVLSCVLYHSPLACDYSHSEILIRHRIFKEQNESPYFDETYTYESWAEKTAMLKKQQGKFFKELKKAFRADMIALISRSPSQNKVWNDILLALKIIKISSLDQR